MFDKVQKVLMGLIPLLLSSVPAIIARKAIAAAVNVVEEEVKYTSTKVDDYIVLPVIKMIRTTLGIDTPSLKNESDIDTVINNEQQNSPYGPPDETLGDPPEDDLIED